MLLLASIALALPATAFVASNYQSHTPRAIQASLANAPFDHIVTVVLENQGLCSVYVGCGGSGTYESQLADQNVLVNTWGTINHNSEPNYIALLGAINDGSTSNDGVCCYFETTPNIIDRIESGGLTWQAFAEDAGGSGTCSFSPPRSGDHFPFIDFSDMNTASRCSRFLTTASSTDPEFLAALNTPNLANFIWLTPNDNDNGHDTGVSGADSYLSALVPKILSSAEFTTTKATLLLLYDEGYSQCTNTGGIGECIYASFSGPAANKGVQISPAGASHYSYLSTIEAAWGLPSINSNDAGAPNMLAAFATSCTTNCPPPPLSTSFTASPSTPLVNVQVIFTATTTGGTAPYTVSWNFGDGTTGTGASITHIYASAGSFMVTETTRDSSSPAQTAASSNTLTVSTSLLLSTNLTFLPTTPSVNSPVTFTAATTGGIAPYTISWSFGDGATGTGTIASHTYTTAHSFTVTETAKDSSSPQQTATNSQTVLVLPSLSGNFGSCTNLPQGWSCGNSAPSTSSATIVNGVLETRESNPGLGNDINYYYATTQKGAFPWSPCQAPVSGVIPTGMTDVSANFTVLSYNPGPNPSSDRYHIYIALYFWLPNGPVSAGGSTYQCLDTQVRVENVGGIFSAIGSTATYNPGDSFGWDQVTLQTSLGQSGTLTANVAQQCQADLAAWGIPTNTPCELAGIEIGTEGFQFQELNVNWYNVKLTTVTPPVLTASLSFTPSSPITGQTISFTGSVGGGTTPYAYSWSFGDGVTSIGQNPSHTYSSPGTYTVTLTVTDASSPQQKATASKTLTVTVPALKVSFTFTPSSPQANSLITFTGSGSGGITPYVYSWAFGDGQTASGASVTHTYTTAGTFTVTLTLTDAANTQVISTQSLTIALLPIAPSFTVSTDPTEVNLPVSFSATASGGTPPYVSFSWNFGDGSAPATGNPITHAYASAGTFSVTVTVTDSAGETGTSAAQSVVVNANLAVSSITASPNPASTGQTITFIATTSGGVAPVTCTWNFGDGATGTGCSTTHIYSTAGNVTGSVVVTDVLSVAMSKSIGVKIIPAPQCTVSLVFGPATPEATSPVGFTAAATNCTAPVSFAWSFGDGNTGSGVTAAHIYSTSGTFSVSVTATDSSSPSQIATSSKSVTVVAALAVPSITASPNPNDADASSSFSASINGGVGAVSCNWTFGDGTSSTGCSTTHAYSNPGTFMVVVTAQDSLGVTASKTVSEVINAQPTVSFTITPTSPVVNQSVTLTATTAGGTNPFTFGWNFGDNSSASGNVVNHTYSSAGSYIVTLTAKDANAQTVTSTQTLLVAQSPPTTIFAVTPSSGLTVGQLASFRASVSGGTSPYTFNWNFGDGTTASGNPVNHSFNMPGTYTVTVTVADANAQTATATSSVLVNPLTLVVTISGPTTGTVGSAVTFTATGSGGTTPYTFGWTSTAGSPVSGTGASFSSIYSAIGTFMVSVTITDANLNTSIASQNVTIVALPISANFTVSTNPTIGVQVTFVASASGGTGGYSYSWSFGDSSAATGNPASHTYTTDGSLTVTLTVTDSSMTQTTITQIITVSPSAPTPLRTSFTMSSTSAQAGQPVTFSAIAIGGTSPYAYSWNFGDSSFSTGNPVSHTFAAGNYTVSLTVTDSSVLSETAVASQTITITTGQLTLLVPSSQTINEGSPLTFNVSATGDPSRTISIACDNCHALGAAFTTNGGLGFSSGNFTWTPSEGQGSSTYLVRISASDGALVVSANVSIFVNEVIEQPVLIVPGPIHVSQGDIIHFMVNLTDPDSAADDVTLAASGLPNGASFDPSTGIFYWNVSSVQPGPYVITFTATSDGSPALQDSNIVTIHVDNGNGKCFFCNFFSTARSVLHASTLPTNLWLLLVGGTIGLTTTLAVMTRRARAHLRPSRRKVCYVKKE